MIYAHVTTMSAQEVEMALDWAANEGWNPGLQDAALFRSADPQGFLISKNTEESIATLSAVRYGKSFGFIGLYIVHSACRGKGFGWEIWNAGMQYLEGRSIGLDGVVAQQDNYRKSGFVLHHRNIRFEGCAQPSDMKNHDSIVPLGSLPIDHIIEYDRRFFPEDRSIFLANWIGQPNGYALGITNQQNLVAYGVMRQCKVGYKIGPLFADTDANAEALYQALCAKVVVGSPIFLDVPECNTNGLLLAQRHSMKPAFEAARMYKGAIGDTRLNQTYGITTFELG